MKNKLKNIDVKIKRILAAFLTLGLVLIGAGISSSAAHAAEPIMLQFVTNPLVGTATPDDEVKVTVVARNSSGAYLDGLQIILNVDPTATALVATTDDGFAEFSLGTLEAQEYSFNAQFFGDANWMAADAFLDYDVWYNQDAFAIVPVDVVYGDTGLQLTTEGAALGSSITWQVTDGDDVVSIDSTTGEVTVLAAGSATVEAFSSGNATTREATATYTLTVAPREATVTAFATPDTIVFGETADLSYFIDGLLEGDTIDGSVTLADIERIGENDIVEYALFANPNYNITFVPGVLTINANQAQQQLLNVIAALPEEITNDNEVRILVKAYKLLDTLSDAEIAALPAGATDTIDALIEQAAEFNHANLENGVTASAETLPWSVKLVSTVKSESANDFAAFESKLPADRALVALYDIHFVDLLTGATWQPAVGEPVSIELADVDIAGLSNIGVSHLTVASTLETIDATVDGSTVSFEGASFSQYGVTSDETVNDDLAGTGLPAFTAAALAATALLAGLGGLMLLRRRVAAK